MTYRVCDYIADELYRRGVRHVYGLMGGGASGLNDGFIKNSKLKYITFHNEQGAGHAAVGEAKFTGEISVVNPTTGCGGTNCMTSLLGAWQDSVPVIFISGNVHYDHCTAGKRKGLRKYGIQEHNIIETVKSTTKYATFISSADQIIYELDKAISIATTNRKGPVWIDIPSNVQTAILPSDNGKRHTELLYRTYRKTLRTSDIINDISLSMRPAVLAGQGVKQSNTEKLFIEFIEKYNIPFITTYGARDIVPYIHPLNIGAIGIKGSRAGNFVMQSADLLITVGTSLNNSHVGYDLKSWSPNSKKYIIDIDYDELMKYSTIDVDHIKIMADLCEFFESMLGNLK